MLKKFFQQFDLAPPPPSLDVTGLLTDLYIQQVGEKQIEYDPVQIQALERMQTILEWLVATDHNSRMVSAKTCQSLYMYGGVGRGKSMLMALFYDACPIGKKRRVHFNTFMQEVHAFIHTWRLQNRSDAITALAETIRESAKLLCFDEFHVTDIADAMILGRLFSKLFELKLVVVITSNRHPTDLYQGGLQREQFLFFVEVLEKSAHIMELAAGQDYRMSFPTTQNITYYCPLAEPLDALTPNTAQLLADHAQEFLWQYVQELTGGALLQSVYLNVLGRDIELSAAYEDILFSSFEELCGDSLGSADYLAIAKQFNVIIIAAIPRLGPEKRNEAKRFLTLIDVLYEHTTQLVCSAEVPAQDLYPEGDGAFEFKRTISRLMEMQSDNYYQRAEALRKQHKK
jgi:cell division protein ZapE